MTEEPRRKKKFLKVRLIILGITIIILFSISVLLFNIGIELFIIIPIAVYIFLLIVGPVMSGIKKSYYKRIFPDKHKINRKTLKDSKKNIKYQRIKGDLDFKYHKPLIRRCSKCRMTLTSSVKLCPNCGDKVID